jgi:hypothetical protein
LRIDRDTGYILLKKLKKKLKYKKREVDKIKSEVLHHANNQNEDKNQ